MPKLTNLSGMSDSVSKGFSHAMRMNRLQIVMSLATDNQAPVVLGLVQKIRQQIQKGYKPFFDRPGAISSSFLRTSSCYHCPAVLSFPFHRKLPHLDVLQAWLWRLAHLRPPVIEPCHHCPAQTWTRCKVPSSRHLQAEMCNLRRRSN